jgi:hypothetical protein
VVSTRRGAMVVVVVGGSGGGDTISVTEKWPLDEE